MRTNIANNYNFVRFIQKSYIDKCRKIRYNLVKGKQKNKLYKKRKGNERWKQHLIILITKSFKI